MSKRKIAWIVIALVGLLSAAGLVWSMFGSDRLTFTAEELQSLLNQQLPRTARDVTIERAIHGGTMAQSVVASRPTSARTALRSSSVACASA